MENKIKSCLNLILKDCKKYNLYKIITQLDDLKPNEYGLLLKTYDELEKYLIKIIKDFVNQNYNWKIKVDCYANYSTFFSQQITKEFETDEIKELVKGE